MLTHHYQFLSLVEYFYLFCHDSIAGLFMIGLVFDGNRYRDGIANKNRAGKAEALIAIGHRYFVDDLGCEPNGHGEDEGAMCYALFEGLGFAPFFIHVVGEKIARLSGMKYNIGLGNGAAHCFALLADLKCFVIFFQEHFWSLESGVQSSES